MFPVKEELDAIHHYHPLWNTNHKNVSVYDTKLLSTRPERQSVLSSQHTATGVGSIPYFVTAMDTENQTPHSPQTETFLSDIFANEEQTNSHIPSANDIDSLNLQSVQQSFSQDVLNCDLSSYSSVPSSPSLEYANSIGVPFVDQQIHSSVASNSNSYNTASFAPQIIRMMLPSQNPPSPTGWSLKELIPIIKTTSTPQFAKPTQKDVWEWLCSISLKEYYQDFIDNGFDDIETISDLTDEEVKAVFHTSKFGHLKKLVKCIGELKQSLPSTQPHNANTNLSPQLQSHTLDLTEVHRSTANSTVVPARHTTKYFTKKSPTKKANPISVSPGPLSPTASENEDNSTPSTPGFGTYQSPNANISLTSEPLMTHSSSDELSEAVRYESDTSDIAEYSPHPGYNSNTLLENCVTIKWFAKGTKRKRADKSTCLQTSVENPLQFVQGKKLQPFPIIEIQEHAVPQLHSIKVTLWKCDIRRHNWKPTDKIPEGLTGETAKEIHDSNHGNSSVVQVRFDKVKLNNQPKEEKKGYLYCFKFSVYANVKDQKPIFKLTSHMFTILSHNSQRLKSPQSLALLKIHPDFGRVKTQNSAVLFGHFPLIPDYRIQFDRYPAVINYSMNRPPTNILSVFTPPVNVPCRVDIHMYAASYHHGLPNSYTFLKGSEFKKKVQQSGNPNNSADGSGNSPAFSDGSHDDYGRNSPSANDPNNNNRGGNFSGGFQGGRTQTNSSGEDDGKTNNKDTRMNRSGSTDSTEYSSCEESDTSTTSQSSREDRDDSDDPQEPSNSAILSKLHSSNVNVVDSFGFAPLHKATCKKNLDLILALLRIGADVNLQDAEGYTPLMWAIAVEDLEAAELLLRFHGDPNIPDVYGLTPLHVAVGLEDDSLAVPLVKILLKYKADPSAQDIYQETPLDYATELEKRNLLKLMQDPEEEEAECKVVPSVTEYREEMEMKESSEDEEPKANCNMHEQWEIRPTEEPAAFVEPLIPALSDPLTKPEPLSPLSMPPAVKEEMLSRQKVFLQKHDKTQKPREYDVSLPGVSFGINPEHYDSLLKLSITKCPNLRTLPYNIAFCQQLDSIHVDWKQCQKISDPPRDIIEKGAFAVREYMSHVISGETTTSFYGRAKIIFLGPSLAGKTSILKVLNALRARGSSTMGRWFKPNPQDFAKLVSGGLRTLGVDVNNRDTRFGDAESEFVTYDFGGEPEFASMYRHFISAENALYVVTFDISSDENGIYQQVKEWVEFLKLYIPDKNFRENKIRLVLIGNKADKLLEPEIFRRLQMIRDRSEELANYPVIGTSCLRLLYYMIDVDGKRRAGDFGEISQILANQARRVNAFGRIPQLFKTIQDIVEYTMEQQNAKDFLSKIKGFLTEAPEERINYIFSWKDFVIWCQSMGFDCEEKLLVEAAEYLHTVGTAVVSRQTRAVCIDPRKFGKILGAFLAETTKSKLQILEKDFETSGILESKIVPTIFDKLLTHHGDFMVHADDSSYILQVMENYDLCFRIPKSDNALFPSLRRSGKPAFPVVLRDTADRMDTNTPDRILCFGLRLACETGARSLFRSFQIGIARDFVFQSMYQDSVSVKDHKTDTWMLSSLHKEAINVVIMGEQPSKMQFVALDKIRYLRGDEDCKMVKLCPKCCFEDPMASTANELIPSSLNQQKLLKCSIHGKLSDEPKLGYKIPDELQSSANQLLNVRTMEENEVSTWELYTPSLLTNWDKWGKNSFRRMILKKPFPKKTTEERYAGILTSDITEVERVENAWKSMLGARVGEFEITRITVLENPQQEKIFEERWMQLNAQCVNSDPVDCDPRMQTFVSECSKLYHVQSKHYSNANSFTSLRANLAVGWWNGKPSQFSTMADSAGEALDGNNGKGYYFKPYPLFSQDSLKSLGYDMESVMMCWVMLGNSCTVERSQQVPNGTHDSVFRVNPETPEFSGTSHEITVFDKSAILPRYVVHYRLMNAVLWIDDHHQSNNRLSIQKLQEYGTHVFAVDSKEEAQNWLSQKHNRERYRGLPGDRFRIICNKPLMLDDAANRLGANSMYSFIRSTWQHTPILIYCGKYEDKLWMPENKLYITTDASNLENFALMEPLNSIKRYK